MNNSLSTFPVKNIDFGQNYIEISNNVYTGHKATLRVDKLSFTSEPKNRENLICSLKSIKSTSKYKVKHYEATGDLSKLYTRAIKISSKKNKNIGLIIHYKPKVKNINFIRFELSPQHIKPKKMAYLIHFLSKPVHLDDEIFELLKIANVTRIDIALDLYDVSTSNYYFGLKGATKGKLHSNDNCYGFSGVRLGSYNSTVQISAYDKIYTNNDYKSNIKHYLYHHKELMFMRIESRIKPNKSNKIMLSDLIFVDKLSNPFERLSIYPLGIKKQLVKYNSFCNLLDTMTIPEALVKIEKGYAKDCIRKILEENKICLFDADKLWEKEKMKCMTLLGVLQTPAYWNRKNWEKHIKHKK